MNVFSKTLKLTKNIRLSTENDEGVIAFLPSPGLKDGNKKALFLELTGKRAFYLRDDQPRKR